MLLAVVGSFAASDLVSAADLRSFTGWSEKFSCVSRVKPLQTRLDCKDSKGVVPPFSPIIFNWKKADKKVAPYDKDQSLDDCDFGTPGVLDSFGCTPPS